MPASRRHEARNWRAETLAEVIHIRPTAAMRAEWHRRLMALRQQDHELWATVGEVIAYNVDKANAMTYEEWRAGSLGRARKMRRIYQSLLRRRALSKAR